MGCNAVPVRERLTEQPRIGYRAALVPGKVVLDAALFVYRILCAGKLPEKRPFHHPWFVVVCRDRRLHEQLRGEKKYSTVAALQ